MTIKPTGEDYDNMAKLAQSILLDYGFYTFPIDGNALACKIGMRLIPYSSLSVKQMECLLQKTGTEKGITVSRQHQGKISYDTYYNDEFSEAACRFTIAHEIKHIVAGDCIKNEADLSECDEVLADYFAKCLLAPQAIIIKDEIEFPEEHMNYFGLSRQAALIWSNAVKNRRNKFGSKG